MSWLTRSAGRGSLILASALGATMLAQTPSASDRVLEDLTVVRDDYVMKTRAYAPETRARAMALVADARTHASSLSKSDLHLRLLEIAALADNGHDALSFANDAARPARRMPYRVVWFPDGLLIVRATGAARDLAGARIEAIDGISTSQLYTRLARFAGGVESQRRLTLGLLLESPELLHAAGLARADDGLTLDVQIPGHGREQRTIAAIDGAAIPRGFGAERLLSPDAVGPAEANWTFALGAATTPLSLRDGNSYFRLEPLLEGSALYVQVRINVTYAGQDIGRFQERVISSIGLHHPTDVVLDLRFDTGGDLQTTLAFMKSLPSRVPGRVYVLISRYTFSAGIVSAAAVKQADRDRVVLVGEPVGDRLRFWSEGGSACLPHAGFCLHYTDGLWDLAKGCRHEAGCYGDQFGVNVGDLDPALAAPLTAADYLAGRDRAMELVLAQLH
jgi:hypothetical protein